MNVEDIPRSAACTRRSIAMRDLLTRASSEGRASWLDLLDLPGIYVVQLAHDTSLEFLETCGLASDATPCALKELRAKHARIHQSSSTDILYLGKGDNIRNRVRQLARFGVGRAANHRGGEWLWQVARASEATVVIQSTPTGKQVPFEGWLLETYFSAHGAWPLANRMGPEGVERWNPLMGT